MQRATMGRHFFPFFAENIKKYKYKLPSLQPFIGDLIEDMRLFLIENLWLPAEDGKLKLSIIETVSYERAMELFGNPKRDCCTYYLSDLLYISLIISIFVSCLKAF